MRDNEGSGFFYIAGLGEWTNYIYVGYWVVFLRIPWKLVFLIQCVNFRKNGDVYFELIN